MINLLLDTSKVQNCYNTKRDNSENMSKLNYTSNISHVYRSQTPNSKMGVCCSYHHWEITYINGNDIHVYTCLGYLKRMHIYSAEFRK